MTLVPQMFCSGNASSRLLKYQLGAYYAAVPVSYILQVPVKDLSLSYSNRHLIVNSRFLLIPGRFIIP